MREHREGYIVEAFLRAKGTRSCSIVGEALFLDRGECDIQRLLPIFERSLRRRDLWIGEEA